MKDLKSLRGYLIKRFLLTIIFLSITEYAALSLMRRTLIPFVIRTYLRGADWSSINPLSIIVGFIVMLVLVILDLLGEILPGQFGLVFDGGVRALRSLIGGFFSSNSFTVNMNIGKEIILLVFLLAMALLILVPIGIAAAYYSAVVVRRVRKLEERDREKQKEYDRSRNLMLSDIAHDLRTPMTTVSGYAKALSDGMIPDEKVPEILEAIQSKSERMNELINLLFDYVRLDSEGFTLNKESLDICELLRETAALLYQDIEDAGMELVVSIPDEKIKITGDKLQLSRVVTNLITNAMKHNDEGTVIGLILKNDEDEGIKIAVADTGEEIPEEKVDTLFDPFVMGDESRQSKGGSGLGLSIVKKVVEMHEFRIKLLQNDKTKDYDIKDEEGTIHFTKAFVISIPI